MIKTTKEFKQIPRFRIKFQKDREPIAIGTRALKGDHLFFYGKDKLGIYFSSTSPTKTKNKRKKWIKKIHKTYRDDLSTWGDFDGILVFEVYSLEDIPKEFFRHKKRKLK